MFFTFLQNNSGGRWHKDANLDAVVIIEANSGPDANAKAQTLGIYFNGVREGRDCRCCGSRWDEAGEGFEKPTLWEDPLELLEKGTIIHYADGRILRGEGQRIA